MTALVLTIVWLGGAVLSSLLLVCINQFLLWVERTGRTTYLFIALAGLITSAAALTHTI